MLQRLQRNPSTIISKIFDNNNITWESKTKDKLKAFDFGDTNSLSQNELKAKVKVKFNENSKAAFEKKSKLRYLEQTEQNYQHKRKKYIQQLNRKQASIIFKVRTRMLPVKCNFKSSYTDLTCRLCGFLTESQDHVLFECPNSGGLNKTDLFQD